MQVQPTIIMRTVYNDNTLRIRFERAFFSFSKIVGLTIALTAGWYLLLNISLGFNDPNLFAFAGVTSAVMSKFNFGWGLFHQAFS